MPNLTPHERIWMEPCATTLTICLTICAGGLLSSGCRSNWTRSVEAQTDLLLAQPLVCPDGCAVDDGQAVYRFTGRVYILPEQAYRALMLTE